MANWLVVFGFWGFSAMICLPVLMGGPATVAAVVFLFLLMVISTYLYSNRFAALVHWIVGGTRTI